MYSYTWDIETGGLLLNSSPLEFSKEPRPVYYKELDILGFDKYWNYEKDDTFPYMWAEANNYWYRGVKVAKTKGGSIYTKPEIILLEEHVEENDRLKFIDIPLMIEKNKDLLNKLTNETIKQVYNTFIDYKDKVDIFHVSYSGGKDSEVTLDIIKKSLPHNDFVVIFSDTGMEFPDTHICVEKTRKECQVLDISFFIAHSDIKPIDSWKQFGPPSSVLRWCCGVHKTAPQLLKLKEVIGKNSICEMAFVGVRKDESARRREYDYISLGTKHKGQYSYYPILEWNTAEIYLYMYSENLQINEAYKKGSGRAGCLLCPMASSKSDFFNRTLYPKDVDTYIDLIKEMYIDGDENIEKINSYIENKGWKARKNGRDLSLGINDYTETIENKKVKIITKINNNWKLWFKTIGNISEFEESLIIDANRNNQSMTMKFNINELQNNYMEFIFEENDVKYNSTLFKDIKNILKKSHSCVNCNYCTANCPYGNISFVDGKLYVSDNCIKCGQCNKIDNGCLVYNSILLPKGNGKMRTRSLDEYGTHAPKLEWILAFRNLKDEFNKEHKLGSVQFPMFRKFLKNTGLLEADNSINIFTNKFYNTESDNKIIWAIMLVNTAYSSQIGWFIKHIEFFQEYNQTEIKNNLSEYITTKTGPGNVANAYRRISELPFSELGFGNIIGKGKQGYIIKRKPWEFPEPIVILYALYKFAENCGDYYQFTLKRLLDHNIDSDGISPTEIFGIKHEQMEKILTGLSITYPDFINVSFTLGLDNITLRNEKTSNDVIELL